VEHYMITTEKSWFNKKRKIFSASLHASYEINKRK